MKYAAVIPHIFEPHAILLKNGSFITSDLPNKVQSAVTGVIGDLTVLVCGGNVDGYDERAISNCISLDTSATTSTWTTINSMMV